MVKVQKLKWNMRAAKAQISMKGNQVIRVLIRRYFVMLIQISSNILYANSGYPDQTPRFVASDLGLRCLPMSHKKDARLIWVEWRFAGVQIMAQP